MRDAAAIQGCRRAGRRALLAAALLAGAACGRSPATAFFTLAPVRTDAPTARFAGAPVQVRAVHIPDVLDRAELITARSGERLDVHQFQQWAAPLANMIRRVLSEDLTARLPAGMVVPATAPPAPGQRGVVVDIQQFEPGPDGRVRLEAAWALLNGAGQPTERRRIALEQSASETTDVQVRAMSALLGRLADAIADSLRAAAA